MARSFWNFGNGLKFDFLSCAYSHESFISSRLICRSAGLQLTDNIHKKIQASSTSSKNTSSEKEELKTESGDSNTGTHASSDNAESSGKKGKWKWYWIPPWVGIGYLAYHQLSVVRRREKVVPTTEDSGELDEWLHKIYMAMPLRTTSRMWGYLSEKHFPWLIRKPFFTWYINKYNCDMSEALVEDLKFYKTIQEFFVRPMKANMRPVDEDAIMVSPSDGTILHCCEVKNNQLEQVKGVRFSLHDFLGPPTWLYRPGQLEDEPSGWNFWSWPSDAWRSTSVWLFGEDNEGEETGDGGEELPPDLRQKSGTKLFQAIVYLAPGDYHGIHSPVRWKLKYRRHFPGELFSVHPGVARWLHGLFVYNERVLLTGTWRHGFFSMTPVGATNVGSINVDQDKFLATNRLPIWTPGEYFDRDYCDPTPLAAIPLIAGQRVGEFRLGSSIVLIFEAPATFRFTVRPGQKVRMGQRLGALDDSVR